MKTKVHFRELVDVPARAYWLMLAVLAALIAVGGGAALYMEHHGHWVTGMNNQVVWGTPHVFAVFLIVAASGALNVASIGTVFGRTMYQPLARLSALMAIALLVGGLLVLVLDLGRPDRLIVAMTSYNFKSIFAWNIFLYTGFMAVTVLYLWTMFQKSLARYYRPAGFLAFGWRLILTTGTGSIFGFLVARQAYDAAIMAPLFILMSFSFGLAIFMLVTLVLYGAAGRPIGDALVARLKNLLGVFVAAVLFVVAIYHVTNLYATEHHGVEAFILRDGGIYTFVFWAGQVLLGSLVPLALLFHPTWSRSRAIVSLAAALVVIGGFAAIYVIIIGGQAYPLVIFPNQEVIESGFVDGVVAQYAPSLPEVLLGLGGIGVALFLTLGASRILRFAPVSLADSIVDPHHAERAAS
ncbi:MAG: polysulfide reductase NrfD [Chromatiales bacterium]|nr:polysulfide reductase NrfD [Chromatiales bacterium]